MRKLKFDLQVDPTALLAANPEAFYSQAYLSEDTADNYRALPGVKYKTKLATVTFGNILQPSTCSFTAPNDDLDAKEKHKRYRLKSDIPKQCAKKWRQKNPFKKRFSLLYYLRG